MAQTKKTATKPRQGEVQYSVEKAGANKGYELIIRTERDDKVSVAKYDRSEGVLEMLPGYEKYMELCIKHLNNKGLKYKLTATIGTKLDELQSKDIPPRPKKSRIQGEKTVKLVEWYARYHRDIFLAKYGCVQLQERVRIDTYEREVRNSQTGAKEIEKVKVPVYESCDHMDFSINMLKSGEQRMIALRKTHLTHVDKDDSSSDEYDDDLDAEIMYSKDS